MYAALLILLAVAANLALWKTPRAAASERAIDFDRDIQSVFKSHCLDCHGAGTQESGLRLDVRAAALRGGDHGPLLVAGKSAKSELFRRVSSEDKDLRMPPDGARLTARQIGLLRAWIDQGAKWPDDGIAVAKKRSDHWAFQRPHRWAPPVVRDRAWCRNPIDAFVLAKLESKQLAPSPVADRNTLLRRLHLDLIGLPPTSTQIDVFLNDSRSGAYERLVERLLASPHFGERWGRHWLDLARYADSNGYERDDVRPNAWRYRDWVLDAMNRDLPYDQFVVEQLAGGGPNSGRDDHSANGQRVSPHDDQEYGVGDQQRGLPQPRDR